MTMGYQVSVEASMAEIIYTAVTDASALRGTLFQGAKFWLSQKVPQRSRFIEQIKVNDLPISIRFLMSH